MRNLLLPVILWLVLGACNNTTNKQTAGIIQGIDSSIKPGNNFFMYVNHKWYDTTKIDGFTPDQRFFISVVRIWRVKMKDEFLRLWINNNPHSPPLWRVNGSLMNNPHFYEAFGVKPGDYLYLPDDKRVHIW